MTWKSFHNRGEVLRAVIATSNVRRNGLLPMDVDGVAETFGDELTLLAALQLKWHTRLAGHIERALVVQPLDLPRAVTTAWAQAAAELPGVRLLLDQYRVEPLDDAMGAAMSKATVKEYQMLAVMAGLASFEDAAGISIGARIEEQARAVHIGREVTSPAPAPSFLDRLRSVLAA